jgi:hypothetical protein
MKHDLQAFCRDIVTLIKTNGDTGGSGDKSTKSLRYKDDFVPSHEVIVSPVPGDWGQPRSASGDKKMQIFESVTQLVPSVPTATANFEDRQDEQRFEDTPSGWHAILEELKLIAAPEWTAADRWIEMIGDADAFLSGWDRAAYDLGWRALNLFGVHAAAPGVRYDVMGLCPLLGGGRVFALTEHSASIRRCSGSTLTYTRKPSSGAVLVGGKRRISQ